MKKFFFFVAALFCLLGELRAQDLPEKPHEMTALVGRSCVINQLDKDLVDVFGNISSLGNLVDTNTDNYVSLSGLAGVELAFHPIISVKDVEHCYGGEGTNLETGFVLQSVSNGTNLLTADVLKMFVIETYLNGEKQESSVYDSGESGLLDLNLITVSSDGKTKVSIRTNKVFDEVRLAVAGVNVEAFKQLKLYYAYVGENEMRPITQTHYYPNASVHGHKTDGLASKWTSAMWNWPKQKEKLVGKNSESDGVGFGTISGLLTDPHVTINAGETIPANTEIGFMVESGSVLAIELFNNTVLTTYDENDNEVESQKIVSVLGLSALGGGKSTVSMVTTKPCQQIKIQFGGLNIDLGGTKIFYAYTRDAKVKTSEQCDLKLSADIAVCGQSSVQLHGVSGITWSIKECPEGTNPTVSSTGLVENMTKAGVYVIQAQKGNCIDYITINNSPSSQISYECNRPIVGNNVEPYAPAGGGCLLCLSPELDDNSRNVVDEDLTNYIEYTKGLDLLSNTSIYGVQKLDGEFYASEAEPRRVGFVMQATDQFLTADLLKFFVIKTYLGDKLQESSPIEQNDAVDANLIGGMGNQMRYSFVATKPFNKVTLWTAGVLSLHLSKFRIYYAFEEPAQSDCMSQYSSSACISLLSAQNGATINYERTGFNGVANVGASMRNLANVVDGEMDTYAFINKTAGVAANTTLSVKANQIFEHGYQAGFVVEEQTWVGNVDLLRSLKIKTYLNGVETGDESIKPEVLSLDLIGSYGKSLIAITPTRPFDEIVLDMGGLVDALVELKVYGAFVQPDTDGDGIPDCMDKNPCGEEIIVNDPDPCCIGNRVEVYMSGGKGNAEYALQIDGKTYPFVNGTASFEAEKVGVFNCSLLENGIEVYTNIIVSIHPLQTRWTGAVSSDWNDWNNWTEGKPHSCTNVIIPSLDSLETLNGVHYPILEEGKSYCCSGIHFAPGAEVIRHDLLTYEKAWVELKVLPERQYLVSVPLKETYSGDIFIGYGNNPEEVLPYESRPLFSTLLGNVRRVSPTVNSRSWNGRWGTNSNADVALTSGFSVKASIGQSAEAPSHYIFRFGKEDLSYQRYTIDGALLEDSVAIPRNDGNLGRFIFERTDNQEVFPYRDTLEIKSGSNFLVGNPFMAHLNVSKFIEALNANETLVQPYVKVYDGNSENSTVNPTGAMVKLEASNSNAMIAPMEAFFIESVSNKTRQIIIPFTPDMMVHGDYTTAKQSAPQTKSKTSGSTGISLSNIKAYAKDGEAVISASETIKSVQIVTAAGQVLASKQPNSMEVRMPLGQGMNIVKVQTENNVQIIKLINN